MKRELIGTFLFSCFLVPTYLSAEDPSEAKFSWDAKARARYELMDWLRPETGELDSSYGYSHLKAQFGMGYGNTNYKAYVQGQYFQLFDLPRTGTGPGSVYRSTNDAEEPHPGSISVRQAFLQGTLHGDESQLEGKAGRFLYANGFEKPSGNASVDWLIRERVSNRLIGSFDFTAGRSFDGGQFIASSKGTGSFSGAVFRPTEGGFKVNTGPEISEITVASAALTSDLEWWPGDGQWQLFYYFYEDGRDEGIVKTDNRPLDVRTGDTLGLQIHTLGTHIAQNFAVGEGRMTGLFWGALQAGDWGEQNHHAYAVLAEVGYHADWISGKPGVRLGGVINSGDDNSADGDHDTFFQMLPTGRQYALTPFYAQMNLEEAFIQFLWEPVTGLALRSDFRGLWLASDEDLLYSGSGANKSKNQFGYSGSSSGGETTVGTLLDISASYAVTPEFSVSVYYGHVFGGAVLEESYDRSDIDYGFVELNYKI